MRKVISVNAVLITGFLLMGLGVLSFYAYSQTRKACDSIRECRVNTPKQTEMLWDAFSHQMSVSSQQ